MYIVHKKWIWYLLLILININLHSQGAEYVGKPGKKRLICFLNRWVHYFSAIRKRSQKIEIWIHFQRIWEKYNNLMKSRNNKIQKCKGKCHLTEWCIRKNLHLWPSLLDCEHWFHKRKVYFHLPWTVWPWCGCGSRNAEIRKNMETSNVSNAFTMNILISRALRFWILSIFRH